MYIRNARIENIRSITDLKIEFEENHEAGWHVIIGDNGAGKTALARALVLPLMSAGSALSLALPLKQMVKHNAKNSRSTLQLLITPDVDTGVEFSVEGSLHSRAFINLAPNILNGASVLDGSNDLSGTRADLYDSFLFLKIFEKGESMFQRDFSGPTLSSITGGWFSCSFGPLRRFRGDGQGAENLYKSYPQAGAHLTLFRDDLALTEIEPWLQKLYMQGLEDENNKHLKSIVKLINATKDSLASDGLLPNGVVFDKVTSEGVFFKNVDGTLINLHDLSDGYRSVLSLTFELIRQLVRSYGEDKVFKNISEGNMLIDLPGVVIIDEVDAHLHPTWQTSIGQWFTKYFPKLQFIVTTHSPLICRACGEHGKIFQLSTTDSGTQGRELKGIERDRLVYGDILEAYETDAFGDGVEWSEEGRQLQAEYRDLVYKKRYGADMQKEEIERLEYLKQIFHLNVESK